MNPYTVHPDDSSPDEAFVDLMNRLRERDPQASQAVFSRYVNRLVALARTRLAPQVRQKEDPEDIVQSVFRSFFKRYEAGSMDFQNWQAVWGMLSLITSRKCSARAKYYLAECRDVKREQLAAATESQSGAAWDPGDGEPSPEEIATLRDTIEALLASFSEARHRDIVRLTLEGLPAADISERLGCSERMVHRTLERARAWLAEQGQSLNA